MTTYASLCSGAGGLDRAVEEVFGAVQVWHAELDPDASKVMATHWATPNLGDITAMDWSKVARPDLLCGGPPCQPVSVAGRRKGDDDDRWLWPDVLRAVGGLRPRWLVFENPPGIAPWLPAILRRLARLGYLGSYGRLRASDVGACHRRERVFVVAADASGDGRGLQPVGVAGGSEAARGGDAGPGAAAHPDGLGRQEPSDVGEGEADMVERPIPDGRLRGSASFPWGKFEPAIDRHADILGRPAPWPVVDGTRSLSGDFTEWMLMWPENWLEVGISNTAKKRICGNGVVTPQAVAALRLLRERVAA